MKDQAPNEGEIMEIVWGGVGVLNLLNQFAVKSRYLKLYGTG